MMAEGGYDPTDPTNERTPLNPGGGNDDDEWGDLDLSLHPIPEEQDTDTTQPFKPGASSTPSGGEQIPMATRLPPEQQGARGGTAETSFITGAKPGQRLLTKEQMAREEVVEVFKKVNLTELDFQYTEKPRAGGMTLEVKYHTKNKWYPVLTKSRGDTYKTLNQSLSKEIKDALGPYTPRQRPEPDEIDEAIDQTNAELQELQQQEATQLKSFQQAETKAAEAQRLRRDMDAIRARTQDVAARMQELENTHGPLDKEAIQKLKDEKRKLATEHQAK